MSRNFHPTLDHRGSGTPDRSGPTRVLIVEDELALARRLSTALERLDYVVDRATRSGDAKELAAVIDYDAIVIARTLSDGSEGLGLLRYWRFMEVEVPIMMMGQGVEADDRVEGLNSGADDYMTKPFPIEEFLARTNQLVRRGARSLRLRMRVDDVEMDPVRRRVSVAGLPVGLASKEFAVLEYLFLHQGEVVTRAKLEEHVWNGTFESKSNVVDAAVYRLRTKIDHDRERPLITTIPGVGYVLKEDTQVGQDARI